MNVQSPIVPAIRTTCPYCGVGCGVLATPDGRGGAAIAGDPDHPANFGKLCSKGSALGETLALETRLLHPMALGADGVYRRLDWDSALDRVANGFRSIIERDGPDAVAFYLSGQLLTEDYYVANKLMKGFIGSANVDTNSRLCMASSVAGHRRAFGADTVPCNYEDIDESDLIVLVGSNAAWCHPVLFQRMERNKTERGARIVVIDPRRTATAEEADLFLAVEPGMDTVLFAGLLVHLSESGALDFDYIGRNTTGFDNAILRALEIAPNISAVAAKTGLAAADVERFFAMFRDTRRVLTCFSQGVNQSAQGTDKANAIINCHLATGRIGVPGAGPFSLTGQPNAMGGREVGGLANQLAAHMGFSPAEIDRVGRFWNARSMASGEGLKAVDMFDAIGRGEIKALWVMATNPAVSLPRAAAVRAATAGLELFVISENVRTNDTVECGAHLLLPAAAWGEKDGTVTNSERRISRQRAFLPAPGESKPDWWIVSEVARRMGFADAFAYATAADIFREHAALSAFENRGTRDFDIGGLAAMSNAAFDALEPTLWPARSAAAKPVARFFAKGGFFTPDGKARFIAPEPPAPKERTTDGFPFRLNTGRVRDQWHTMTRSGLSPRLGAHLPEPFVEVHPADADRAGLRDGAFARVTSEHGAGVFRVRFSEGQRLGSLFVPIHWSHATASSARAGDLVAPNTDPFSGQPESKATPVAVEAVAYPYGALLIVRGDVELPRDHWWSRVTLQGGAGYLIATHDAPAKWRERIPPFFAPGATVAEFTDERRGVLRLAAFTDGRLDACLFVGPEEAAPQWDAVKSLLATESIDGQARRLLLSGRSADGIADSGPVVCACFGIGLVAIRSAIESGAADIDAIGKILKAGTNCGSCRPELKRILASETNQGRVADPV
jgi:assimilatory nitrate reductase catalytic subunit